MYYYFPSCNFSIASKEGAKALRQYLNMKGEGCCLKNKKQYSKEDLGIYICQNCRNVIKEKIKPYSFYEYLLKDDSFIYPDYSGLIVNFQDCYRDREYPQVHNAIREILKRMHIEVIEIEYNKENSDFCGTLYYEIKNPELKEKCKEEKLSKESIEIQKEAILEHAKEYTCHVVVTNCNRCTKDLRSAGINAIHIIDLLFQTKRP